MICSRGKNTTFVPLPVRLRETLKANVPPVLFFFFFFFWKHFSSWHFQVPLWRVIVNSFLTHQIPQTPCRSASMCPWCAAGCFPARPGQSEDSYTVGSPRCTHTSSRCSGKRTGPQICSRRSWELPERSGSVNSQVGWPAALWSTAGGIHGGKKLIDK